MVATGSGPRGLVRGLPQAGEPPPLHGWSLVLVTFALAMGNFMEVLDLTIANVAVPTIAGDLGVSAGQGTWVITSYAVANAISVLLAGFLSQRFGQVRVFTVALILFSTTSLLCGFAHSFGLLVFARVMQGAVSGLMVPLSQALLLASYPPERRAIGMAIWAMTITAAPAIGPILGGWLCDNAGWSWIFFINVPFGLTAAALTWGQLAGRETRRVQVPIDWVGLGLIVIWVGSLQIMLDKGNELDWFGSSFITGLGVTALIGFALFIAWELTDRHPIVDLRLFARRSFTGATAALAIGFAIFFATVVLVPLWLQTQLGYTATWAGLVVAPTGLFAVLLAPVVAKTMNRIDPRWYATAAFVVFAVGNWWRAAFTTDATAWDYALPQVLMGFAVALFFAPLITLALAALPPSSVAQGSGIANFLRMTAGAFAASLVITLWDHRQADNAAALTTGLSPLDPALVQAGSAATTLGASPEQALALVQQQLASQAAHLGVLDVFWFSGWAFIIAIGAIWIAGRYQPEKGPGLGAH